jgi:hypothetical protein
VGVRFGRFGSRDGRACSADLTDLSPDPCARSNGRESCVKNVEEQNETLVCLMSF